MNTAEYLDVAMKKKDIRNDSQLADALRWSRAKISNYRNLKQAMDNDAALEFSAFAEVPIIKIIADMELQRGRNPSNKKAWDKLSKEAGWASAKLLITLPFLSFLVPYIVYYVKWQINKEELSTVSPHFKLA